MEFLTFAHHIMTYFMNSFTDCDYIESNTQQNWKRGYLALTELHFFKIIF